MTGQYRCGTTASTPNPYDDATKTKPAHWLADHGWTVDPVQTNPELQREYGRTPPQVDMDLDEIMHSEYITATR